MIVLVKSMIVLVKSMIASKEYDCIGLEVLV